MTSSVSSSPVAEVSTLQAPTADRRGPIRLHRLACFHVFATFALLVAGAAVTSNDAGLAVVDWPTSLGFLNPLAIHLRGLMHGLVAFEHGHREIGMVVGLLTLVESTWLWLTAERKACRVLAVVLVLAVLAQGGLGGLTVKLQLPPVVSVAHGMLAQTFFLLSIATAYVLSSEWRNSSAATMRTRGIAPVVAPNSAVASNPQEIAPAIAPNTQGIRRASIVALVAVYGQLLLGAIVRHTVAKWRVPSFTDVPVLLHAAFAFVVLVAIGRLVATVTRDTSDRRFTRPALLLGVLVMAQLALGLLAIVTRTDPLVTVVHVVTGAAILGTTFFLVLRSHRLDARRQS